MTAVSLLNQIGGGGALNSTIASASSASSVKCLNGRTAVADISGAAGDAEQQQSAQRSDNEFLHLSGLLLARPNVGALAASSPSLGLTEGIRTTPLI